MEKSDLQEIIKEHKLIYHVERITLSIRGIN